MSTTGSGRRTSTGASHCTYMRPRGTEPTACALRSSPTNQNPRREVTGSTAVISSGLMTASGPTRWGCAGATRAPRASAPLGEQGSEVDEDPVVGDELAARSVDRHDGHRDAASVLARVGDARLDDRGIARLPLLDDVMVDTVDGVAEGRPRVADRVASAHEWRVAEAHRRVGREVLREAVGLHRVDVGEEVGVVGHGGDV